MKSPSHKITKFIGFQVKKRPVFARRGLPEKRLRLSTYGKNEILPDIPGSPCRVKLQKKPMSYRIFSVIMAVLASATFARADIINTTLADDGDGVISCTTGNLQLLGCGEWEQSIAGNHNLFGPGHILGSIITDKETDPSLTLIHDLENDTPTAWGGYHVSVKLNKVFTITSMGVDNIGWTCAITQPIQIGSDYVGSLDYVGETPVEPSGSLGFAYKVTFVGTVNFYEEMTPTAVPQAVPEPGTAALFLCGLGSFLWLRRIRNSFK